MKILYLYRYCILGGVSTQLANRLAYLKDRAEVHLGFLQDHGGATAFGDHPHVHLFHGTSAIRALIDSGEFDAVLPIDTPEVFPPIQRSGFQGPVINEVHTTTLNIHYLDEVDPAFFTAMLAPSDYLKVRLEEEFGLSGKVPCYHVPNCLDTQLFRFHRTPVVPQRKIVLWVGKLDDHKNWQGFLTAAEELHRRRQDCEFWMVGGETAPDSTALELFDRVREAGLSSRVRWLQRVEYSDMPRLYSLVAASGGVTVSTSQNESFGMTVIESLACSCPAIGARVGALPEVLVSEMGEVIYPFFDVSELVRTTERVLNRSPEEAAEYAKSGRRLVEDHYSIDKAGQRYLEVLETICQSRPNRAAETSD